MADIRWFIRADLPQILAIEQQGSDPWEITDFCRWLRHHDSRHFVAEEDNKVVGYVVAVGKAILKIGAEDENIEATLRQRIAR